MNDVSLVALLTRTMISLAVVLAVIAVAYRIARRRAGGGHGTRASRTSSSSSKSGGLFGGRRKGQSAPIEVVGRVGLTRGTSAVAIRFGERVVLVAAADQAQSTVLAEMTGEEWDEITAVPEVSTPVPNAQVRSPTGGSALAETTRPSFVEALRQATSRHA